MELTKEMIIAMAVAAVAEEIGKEVSQIRVISFREIKPTALEQYIADHNIIYKKYNLGDEHE